MPKKIQLAQASELAALQLTNEDLLQAFLDHIPGCVYFKDRQSHFVRISRSQADKFGFHHPDEAIGKTDFDIFSEEHARQAFVDEQEIIRTGNPVLEKEEKETWPDGHETWVLTTKLPLKDHAGRILGTMGISQDITQRKRVEQELQEYRDGLEKLVATRTNELVRVNLQLERDIASRRVAEQALAQKAAELARSNQILENMSLTDDLTNLYNRKGFLALADHRVKLANRNREPFSVAFLDMDGLKQINDTYGHLEGDCALKDTANLLRECFRESDIIARLGGDEFAVFIAEADQARITQRIQEKLEELNSSPDRHYPLSFSMGIVESDPSQDADMDVLLKRADGLMYEEKRKGGGSRGRRSKRDVTAIANLRRAK